jgi:Bax protein
MRNTVSTWAIGLTLSVFPLFCLMLIFSLASNPLDGDIDSDELTSNTLLPDFSAINQAPERKQLFIETLLPLIEQKNVLLLSTRERLIEIRREYLQKNELSNVNKLQLESFRNDYNVTPENYPSITNAINVLLMRIDEIPTAMVLAQAAIESGWGTSRFAEEANNLFGQWCYTKGCGIVPERRAASAKHEVQKFDNIEEALNAYYHNINTHRAYRSLRDLRARMRYNSKALSAGTLIEGLGKYCGRGRVYVSELRTLIKVNNLE